MFNKREIADYYNSTQIHYEKWWDLGNSHSLHYGIWEAETKRFKDALANTNRILFNLAEIKDGYRVLDAGCGVGGAAVFIAEQKNTEVTGITLSEKQLSSARALLSHKNLGHRVNFELMDFTSTSFPDQSFDVIWGCESICHTPNKREFMKEASRLLKKGGRLVLFDFFKSCENQTDKNNWLNRWCATWAVPPLITAGKFEEGLAQNGFSHIKTFDYTPKIRKTAKRMFYASSLAMIPSETYKILNPQVSRFARNHYKCGLYQYKALKAGLWKYLALVAEKK